VSFDYKITDLQFRINNLIPKNLCDYFINFYENNIQYANKENSYKYQSKQIQEDNYSCINLSQISIEDKNFLEPLNIAKTYINIMIINYVLYIQKNICASFDRYLIDKSNNIRILKYEKGQFISDHTDVGNLTRASCTLNLNENYEGGEFRFFDGQVKHTFKTGDAIIFPADPIWIHGTEPIIKGTRYSINCFLNQ
jgi:hypothetical protein